MPRPTGDHDARRRDIAAAVQRVLVARGFAGLTLRAVAAELGASTGVVTHYFATKHDLTAFALELLDHSVAERRRPQAVPGLAALRVLVHGMLPLDADGADANRIWISSWDVVLADPERTAAYAATYADSRTRLAVAIRDAQDVGDLAAGDPLELAAAVQACALGLAVQAVIDPEAFPPARQRALADAYLDGLRGIQA